MGRIVCSYGRSHTYEETKAWVKPAALLVLGLMKSCNGTPSFENLLKPLFTVPSQNRLSEEILWRASLLPIVVVFVSSICLCACLACLSAFSALKSILVDEDEVEAAGCCDVELSGVPNRVVVRADGLAEDELLTPFPTDLSRFALSRTRSSSASSSESESMTIGCERLLDIIRFVRS